MKKILNLRFLSLSTLIILCSCQTYQYYPTTQTVLKFKEKGDLCFSLGATPNDCKSSNLGYAITQNVALSSDFQVCNTYFSPEAEVKHRIDDFIWNNEIILFKKYPNSFIPTLNLGYTLGQIDRNSDICPIDFNSWFLQPSIGYSGNYFDVAISGRISKVKFDLHPTQLYDYFLETDPEFVNSYPREKTDYYMLEPAITLGGGFKNYKFHLQYVFVNKFNSEYLHYDRSNFHLSASITINMINLFKND